MRRLARFDGMLAGRAGMVKATCMSWTRPRQRVICSKVFREKKPARRRAKWRQGGSILVCCPLVDRCAGLVDRRTAFAEKGCRADVFVAVAVGQVANRQSVHGLMAVAVHQHEVVLFTNADFQAASIAFVILGPPGVWVGAVVAGRYALAAALVPGDDAQFVRLSLQRPWRAGRPRRNPEWPGLASICMRCMVSLFSLAMTIATSVLLV